MPEIDLTNLVVTLQWLAGPAGIVAWMLFVSNLFRNLRDNDFDEIVAPLAAKLSEWLFLLTPMAYQAVVFVSSIAGPVVAVIVINVLPDQTIVLIQPYYQFVAMLFMSYIGQQIWYRVSHSQE